MFDIFFIWCFELTDHLHHRNLLVLDNIIDIIWFILFVCILFSSNVLIKSRYWNRPPGNLLENIFIFILQIQIFYRFSFPGSLCLEVKSDFEKSEVSVLKLFFYLFIYACYTVTGHCDHMPFSTIYTCTFSPPLCPSF